MADIVDKATRSRMMSGIRGKHTGPELALRRALHRTGLRYRLHVRELPGRPDIVFPRFRAVILVQGCFWHRHAGCRFATNPASNRAFWQKKFAGNVRRDRKNLLLLLENGWRVAVIWECAIRDPLEVVDVGARIVSWLGSRRRFLEIPKGTAI
jgi:DNA mismatch endonuclease (patch repair protein)